MSYILYGGLFDPPHLGHLEIALAAYNAVKPEELIWVPAKYPPHREARGLPAARRVDMLKWWFRNKPGFTVSDNELDKNHSGYSIETIQMFKEKYPDKKSYFLIGTDEAEDFKTWHEWQKILEITTLVIGERKKEADIPSEVKSNAIFLDNKIYEVSSTWIRERLSKSESVRGFIDENILEYMMRMGLYK